jgi:hypothetical protein
MTPPGAPGNSVAIIGKCVPGQERFMRISTDSDHADQHCRQRRMMY